MEKTSIGLDENVAGVLCYVLWWASGLAIYLLETDNKVVRFHALQSIITFGAVTILLLALGWVPVLGNIILPILAIILWIVLMVKAYLLWAMPFQEAFDMIRAGSPRFYAISGIHGASHILPNKTRSLCPQIPGFSFELVATFCCLVKQTLLFFSSFLPGLGIGS